jgi:hypothetical protein
MDSEVLKSIKKRIKDESGVVRRVPDLLTCIGRKQDTVTTFIRFKAASPVLPITI